MNEYEDLWNARFVGLSQCSTCGGYSCDCAALKLEEERLKRNMEKLAAASELKWSLMNKIRDSQRDDYLKMRENKLRSYELTKTLIDRQLGW